MKGKRGGRHDESLCNFCTCGANECEWMRKLKPIDGWKAKLVRCDHGKTYHVISCPQFVPMPHQEEDPRKARGDTNEYLFASKKRRLSTACKYGLKNFCDGTPNPSAKGTEQKPPCKFFIDGKCTLNKAE